MCEGELAYLGVVVLVCEGELAYLGVVVSVCEGGLAYLRVIVSVCEGELAYLRVIVLVCEGELAYLRVIVLVCGGELAYLRVIVSVYKGELVYLRVIVAGCESKVNDHAQGLASPPQPIHKLSWCEPALEGGGEYGITNIASELAHHLYIVHTDLHVHQIYSVYAIVAAIVEGKMSRGLICMY